MHLRYLKSVLRHKRYVFQFGRLLAVPLHQLILHDWSKFTPTEWLGYARKFYGGPYPSLYQVMKTTRGVSVRRIVEPTQLTAERVDDAFNLAWLSHQKRQKHHWQWWVVMEDSGKVYALPMPDRFRREMLADWLGANKAYGDMPLTEWYEKTKGARILHPATLAWVEYQMRYLKEIGR